MLRRKTGCFTMEGAVLPSDTDLEADTKGKRKTQTFSNVGKLKHTEIQFAYFT